MLLCKATKSYEDISSFVTFHEAFKSDAKRNSTSLLLGASPNFAYNIKDTHKEKAPSNKTPALTKSMNMAIWVVGTSNQLLIIGSHTETFKKKKKKKKK